MEVRLRLFLQDLISYLIFLLFLGFVVRGYRDPDAYNFNKALTDDVIHKHFDNVSFGLISLVVTVTFSVDSCKRHPNLMVEISIR